MNLHFPPQFIYIYEVHAALIFMRLGFKYLKIHTYTHLYLRENSIFLYKYSHAIPKARKSRLFVYSGRICIA